MPSESPISTIVNGLSGEGRYAAAGDEPAASDIADGDIADGDTADGDIADGDIADGDTADADETAATTTAGVSTGLAAGPAGLSTTLARLAGLEGSLDPVRTTS